MKTLIICISVHHGNTAKVAGAMASVLGAKVVKPGEADADELGKYDLIGFGSGIFYFKHHSALLGAVDGMPALNGHRAFIFSTAGHFVPFYHGTLRRKLKEKGFEIVGEFSCKGFDTVAPFNLIGGRNKGRPNREDLRNARNFAKSLMEKKKTWKKSRL